MKDKKTFSTSESSKKNNQKKFQLFQQFKFDKDIT